MNTTQLELDSATATGAAAVDTFHRAGSPVGARTSSHRQPRHAHTSYRGRFIHMHGIAAAALTLAVASSSSLCASTYTWTGAAGAEWNATALNWNDGINSGVAWEDDNDAVFPASSSHMQPWINSQVSAGNVTVNGAYTFQHGRIGVSGKFIVNSDCILGDMFGFVGNSVRIDGATGKTIWCTFGATNSTHGLTYLEGGIRLNAAGDRLFGPVPIVPSENIVVESGSPLLIAAASMALDANRSIRIASGATLTLGTGSGNAFTINGVISGTPDASLGFVTEKCISLPYYGGTVVFAPGAGRTNDVGRLHVKQSSLLLASGTTRVGNAANNDGGLATEAALYVQGNGSAYDATRGNLVVDGATLYDSQTSANNYRYVSVNDYAQITVQNGGRIVMPGTQWLNVTGKITVGDGEFVANYLRVSQSDVSEINLDEGGLIAVNRLGIDPGSAKHACQFKFDGGRLQSRSGSSAFLGSMSSSTATDASWSTVVFSVGEKGAGFDTTNGQNIYWTRPLVSRTTSGVDDGGIFVLGSDPTVGVIFSGAATNSSYTGSTVISNAMVKYSQKCALSGRYEFCGDASGCGRLSVAAGQSISGIEIGGAGLASLSTDAPGGTYKILDAPDGFSGEFALAADFPSDKWRVRYTANAAYLSPVKATTIIMR